MRTTVSLDAALLGDARSYTGIKETSALLNAALWALVEREAARRLALLGGSDPGAGPATPAAETARSVILADTSVRIDHFRRGNSLLAKRLTDGGILVHPFVYGELVLGGLRNPSEALADIGRLPALSPARDSEVLAMIARHRLWRTGLGYIDAPLLAATRLVPGVALWTLGRVLRAAAARLGVAASPT